MANEWEKPSRRTLDFLSGGPDGGGSSSSASSPHSSLQHIPAYNYFDSATQHHQLHYQPNTYSSNKRSTTTTTSATKAADRNYRHKMLERAAYANRSFMHHGEYDPPGHTYHHQQQQQHQHQFQPHQQPSFQRSGAGYGGDFVFETSHYPIDQDDRKGDRRRHSMHHIVQMSASKMDDLKQRFDEYSSSSAVGRGGSGGGGGGGGGRSRRPSPRQQNGGGKLGYSGSKSLDAYERTENGGGGRQKGPSGKTPKRGSRSSQGSTDSSHSSHVSMVFLVGKFHIIRGRIVQVYLWT